MVNKKDKPNKKQRPSSEKERDFLVPKKRFTKSDRQEEQDEIERGLETWEYGEEE